MKYIPQRQVNIVKLYTLKKTTEVSNM